MATDMTTFDSALQEDYLPGVRSQLNDTNQILGIIEKNTEDFEGRRAVLSIHMGRSGGIGARGAVGATLPTAGNQTYKEERISTRHLYGRIKVELPAIEASKTDKASFVRAIDSEMKGITNDLKRDTNRQAFGTSNGVLATAALTSNSTTVNVTTATATQMRHFYAGLVVDIGTVASPTGVASARTITAVSRSGKTITISGAAVTTATTDFVFIAGNGGDTTNSSQKELTSLRTIVDSTGALFNLNPATAGQEEWAAYESSNSGTNRSVSESLFAQVMQEVEIASGESVNLWVTSYGVHRAYANLLTAQKTQTNTLELKGGYQSLEMSAAGAGVAFVADRDCPENTAFALNTKHLTLFTQNDWSWMDQDGAILSRVSGEPAYEATLYRYVELATDQRNAHGRVDDLTEA